MSHTLNRYFKRLLAGVGLAILTFCFNYVTHAQVRYKSINKPVTSSKSNKTKQNRKKRDSTVRFITDVNASIDAAGVRGGDYAAGIKRQVRFDVLRIREVFLQFGFQEGSLFDSSSAQLDHEFEYLGIGYKTTKGKIKLFWDHTCYNPSRKLPKDKSNSIHWNELGIGYETLGMMLGHKNHGIRFNSGKEWLNHINWRASLSRIWMRTENVYEWMFKINIRNDIFRMANQVFFCQISFNSIYDERGINLNPFFEIGDRISFNKDIYLTPFVSYKHFHDWYSLGQGEDLLFAGLSLELNLDQKRSNIFLNKERANSAWTPMFNISGGYANFINNNEDYGHKSDVAIDLNLLRFNNDETIGLDTYVGILTLPHDLNPYIVRYKVGPSLKIDLDNFGIRFFHSYSALYGIEYENMIRNYHLIGLNFKDNTASFWNWNLNIGVYPSSRGFDYWGDLQGSLGCHFLKGGITPYINCSGHHLQGNSSLFGHAIEAGVKIPGNTGSFSVYICMQEDFDIFRFGKGSQKLLGLRFKF
jgi:hypothetical protein